MGISQFQVVTIEGKEISLSQYLGKTLLIVNVASQCGFTGQYEGLESLYQKYKERGLVVLGFPCNQFGAQEPGSDEEIKNFCTLNYHVTFPMFSKIQVNGPEAHPLYKFLKSEEKGILGTEAIKWNFTKFLIDPSGKVVKRYGPQVTPADLGKDLQNFLKSAA